MIIHVCSHFGDIEVVTRNGRTVVRYSQLTPVEYRALSQFFAKRASLGTPPAHQGEVIVDEPLLEVGSEIGLYLHADQAQMTAVKFSSGDVEVKKGGLRAWFNRLFFKTPPAPRAAVGLLSEPEIVQGEPGLLSVPEVLAGEPGGLSLPEAAVSVLVPVRGCPMPTATDLKEIKAAAVVRKFLTAPQAADFDERRAFIAVGGYTGHRYRITSRWSPEVEKYGVLHDLTTRERVCASNKVMPPSEEALSMKFAVEHFEQEFLGTAMLNHQDEGRPHPARQSPRTRGRILVDARTGNLINEG